MKGYKSFVLIKTLTDKNIDTRNIAKWISCYYKQEKIFSSNTLFMTMLELQSTLDFYANTLSFR